MKWGLCTGSKGRIVRLAGRGSSGNSIQSYPCKAQHSTAPHKSSLYAVVQAVGDALSGVLMVEAALRRRQWGLQQWGELYQDLPSRQSKVQVQDRSVISTINAETCVASPAGLQPLIDTSVAGQSETKSKQYLFTR